MWLHRIVIALAAYALFAGGLATLYVVEQQEGRNAVEDAPRALLSTGEAAAAQAQPDRVDLTHYLGTFWVQYAADGAPVAGDGYLGGSLARVPRGVLETAKADGEDAVSWAPEPGLRFAIVAQPAGSGVIVAGQSLHRTDLPPGYPTGRLPVGQDAVIRGGSCIIGPLGQVLAGPVTDGEAILTAEIDMREIARARFDFDPVGHYSRPDIFTLSVDETPRPGVNYFARTRDDEAAE